jgi:hypothetical protein
MGALTMLNVSGDTTITWEDDQDDVMAEILQKKMDAGCVFYIINERTGGRKKLKSPADAMASRKLAIPDEDLMKFVSEGRGEVIKTPEKPAATKRKARSGREAAQSETVGIQPRRGG